MRVLHRELGYVEGEFGIEIRWIRTNADETAQRRAEPVGVREVADEQSEAMNANRMRRLLGSASHELFCGPLALRVAAKDAAFGRCIISLVEGLVVAIRRGKHGERGDVVARTDEERGSTQECGSDVGD